MKKKLIILSTIGVILIGIIAGASYAYFTVGNNIGNEDVITSGTMSLLLTDGSEVSANNLIPGEYIEKTFTVKNTGNVDTRYDVYFSEVINTFVDKTDLVYTLTSNDGGYNTTNEVQVPDTETKMVNQQLITPNAEHTYTLRITFKLKQTIQNANMGRTFTAKININEYNIDNNIKYIFDSNMNEDVVFFKDYDIRNYTNFSQPNMMFQGNLDTSMDSIVYTVFNGDTVSTLPYLYKDGYLFDGWYTSRTGGEKITSLNNYNNKFLYAHWITTNYVATNEDLILRGINYNGTNQAASEQRLFNEFHLNNVDTFILSYDYVSASSNWFDTDIFESSLTTGTGSAYEGPQVDPTSKSYNQKFIWVFYHNDAKMNTAYLRVFDDHTPMFNDEDRLYVSNIKLYKYN